jgi:site-specific DNA-cytosine methylase
MKVLSLFDGMSCGQIALNRIGITPEKYYASEIDKHAIKITMANYPDTIQLGDVTKWREWNIDWASIDLLIGGSPCQGFSFAGKQLAFDIHANPCVFRYSVKTCEKLQTVPVGYTSAVSNSQAYKAMINGWTVDVIAHIFRAGLTTN